MSQDQFPWRGRPLMSLPALIWLQRTMTSPNVERSDIAIEDDRGRDLLRRMTMELVVRREHVRC